MNSGKSPSFAPLHHCSLLKTEIKLNSFTTRSRSTPLHLAAQQGHAEIVKLLIQHGANIEALDGGIQTPIEVASKHSHLEAGLHIFAF